MHNNSIQEGQQHEQTSSSTVTYRRKIIMHPNGFVDAICVIRVDFYVGLIKIDMRLFHIENDFIIKTFSKVY